MDGVRRREKDEQFRFSAPEPRYCAGGCASRRIPSPPFHCSKCNVSLSLLWGAGCLVAEGVWGSTVVLLVFVFVLSYEYSLCLFLLYFISCVCFIFLLIHLFCVKFSLSWHTVVLPDKQVMRTFALYQKSTSISKTCLLLSLLSFSLPFIPPVLPPALPPVHPPPILPNPSPFPSLLLPPPSPPPQPSSFPSPPTPPPHPAPQTHTQSRLTSPHLVGICSALYGRFP